MTDTVKKLSDNGIEAICTIPELAKKLGLSRARFYQLQKKGVFPKPLYSGPKRPYYPPDLQQKCIEIRKTGIGYNEKAIVFNKSRKKKYQGLQSWSEHKYEELTDALKQMGLNVSPHKVKKTVMTRYPEGVPAHVNKGTVIGELFRHFTQRL
jgi:hypothetical protein